MGRRQRTQVSGCMMVLYLIPRLCVSFEAYRALSCIMAAGLNPHRIALLINIATGLRSTSQAMYRSPSRYSLSLWHTPQRMCRFSHPSLPPTERATMCARSLPSIPQAKQVPRSKNSASESNPLMAQSLFAQCALIANSDGILRGVVFMAFSVIQLNRAVEWTSHSPLR